MSPRRMNTVVVWRHPPSLDYLRRDKQSKILRSDHEPSESARAECLDIVSLPFPQPRVADGGVERVSLIHKAPSFLRGGSQTGPAAAAATGGIVHGPTGSCTRFTCSRPKRPIAACRRRTPCYRQWIIWVRIGHCRIPSIEDVNLCFGLRRFLV